MYLYISSGKPTRNQQSRTLNYAKFVVLYKVTTTRNHLDVNIRGIVLFENIGWVRLCYLVHV